MTDYKFYTKGFKDTIIEMATEVIFLDHVPSRKTTNDLSRSEYERSAQE
jgi:hypothetical protein